MRNTIFMWDNFGPLHADRCDAVAREFPDSSVVGLELYSESDVYLWNPESGINFDKRTLFRSGRPRGIRLLLGLIKFHMVSGRKNSTWYLCHYDWPEVFIFATWLRMAGVTVYTMGCSKFDDLPRAALRESLKSLFLLPYKGAIGSGLRSREYFRFLGLPKNKIVGEYNTVSISRIQNISIEKPAPDGIGHAMRHFSIVARLVTKKNIGTAIRAYASYFHASKSPRQIHLFGSGPLETELRALCVELGIEQAVFFRGFLQTEAIANALASSLALVLPSTEEQFGNVVIEAQAMGLPVILSDNCGARDRLVRSGVNGFVVEPDNIEGIAWFMQLLAADEAMWKRMCLAAKEFAPRSDVAAFAEGVRQLAFLERTQ